MTTKHLRRLELWQTDGVSQGIARIESDIASVTEVCPSSPQHVADALAGSTVTVRVERDGEPLDCIFAPVIGPGGRIEGAVSAVMLRDREARAREALRERLAFEELITSLSTRFVSLPSESIDEELDGALAAIGEHAGVDRAYLFRFTADGTAMDNTHEWCAPGIEPQLEALQGLSCDAVRWWTSELKARRVIHAPAVADLPAQERAVLEAQGVQSVLAIPMVAQDRVVGFVGFDSVRRAKRWADTDIALLRIASEIFINALERARADREREQLETQLVQARSLENVARLAGGVAHDFNNLLAIILNYAELLKRDVREPAQRDRLDGLFETAQRAAVLTRQLLLVGRRDVVAPVPLDLSEVVASLAALLRQTLGEHIRLQLELADDLDVVRVGRPQIEQVLVNLTLNARDAMARGGVLLVRTENVEITAERAARNIDLEPGRHVRVRIRDQGMGMTPDVAARAFEPFFSTKGAGGTGLGLSSVHGIVKQAGGHVELSTEAGAGTTVDIYFPVSEAPGEVAPSIAAPSTTDVPRGRGEMILVVDDSPEIRKLVCQHLVDAGYRPIESAPGDAVELVARCGGAIDLLVTDVVMPQLSGRELAQQLRDRFEISRVLYMSAYDDEIIARQGVLESGTRLLPKPFLASDLLRAVRAALDEGPAGGTS